MSNRIVLKVVSQTWGGGVSQWWVIDFGCMWGACGGCFFVHFILFTVNWLWLEGLNTDLGAENRGGGSAPCAPSLLPLDVDTNCPVNDEVVIVTDGALGWSRDLADTCLIVTRCLHGRCHTTGNDSLDRKSGWYNPVNSFIVRSAFLMLQVQSQ